MLLLEALGTGRLVVVVVFICLPFLVSRGHLTPCMHGPCLHVQSQPCGIFFLSASLGTDLCDYTGHLDNPPSDNPPSESPPSPRQHSFWI